MSPQEKRDIYWNNYKRKLVRFGFDSKQTIRAHRLYVWATQEWYREVSNVS
jgi:hypothetical protein